jgi:hypothetical protein
MMKWTKWLGLIPYVWLIVCVPFINSVHQPVLGMPFLLLWTMAGVIVTCVVLYIMYMAEYKSWSGEDESRG